MVEAPITMESSSFLHARSVYISQLHFQHFVFTSVQVKHICVYEINYLHVAFMQLPQDPVDIAASIKALAKSVHGDADVFGDLPRPRFSTQI
jgi:hypothetical protein